jgi:hypothetical protein
VDRDVPTYEKWVELFDKNLRVAESRGWPYERVPVKPDDFNEWCKANQRRGEKFDRSLYALELLRSLPAAQATRLESGAAIPDMSKSSEIGAIVAKAEIEPIEMQVSDPA